jgi:plastocyanin
MIGRLATALAVLVSLLVVAPAGRADDAHLTPSWMKADAAAKRVQINIVAGFNATNSALNFNGYFAGDLTVVAPVGWAVEIDFKNNDAMLPHSLLVTKAYPPDHLPDLAGVNEVAIPRAYTDNPQEGIPAPKGDTLRFTAKEAGEYYFFCGAPAHGQGGMWTKFKVDAAATTPYVIVAAGAEPGRP